LSPARRRGRGLRIGDPLIAVFKLVGDRTTHLPYFSKI
jgi:hypothetical protein